MNQQPHLEAYLSAGEDEPALLYPAFQDGVGGLGFPYATYFDLLGAVWEVNQGLAPQDRIRVVAVGSPTWWPQIRTPRDLELFRTSLGSYDHTMYQLIVEEMGGFAVGRKGIFLTNTRHAYKAIRDRDGALFWNAGTFLRQRYPGRTVHIRCNSASLLVHAQREIGEGEARTTEGLERMEFGWGRVADGLWDTAVARHGIWPIAVPIVGNAFGEAPYIGNHMLHASPGQTMADAYDAVLFLAPLEQQRQTAMVADIYTPEFREELARRYRLLYSDEQITARVESTGVRGLRELIDLEHVGRDEAPLGPARAVGTIDAWRAQLQETGDASQR